MTTDEVPAYEKMVDDARRWGLDEAGLRALSRVAWAVTEKIHGANLCLVVEPAGVRAACRSRWLTADDDFFGFQAIAARHEGALRALGASLLGPGVDRVLVYGELFGGAYPHPDVPALDGVAPVQTGVWYAPGLEFSAFDVATAGPGGKRYLAAREAHERLRAASVPCLEPLLVGTYAEAMAFAVGGDTVVPARRGLPPIAGNRAEGVVVRPWEPVEVRDASGRPVRPLLKRKLAAFAEDERFHGAERPRAAPAGVWEALAQRAAWMVNEPRLAAARSKLGAVERRGASGRAELREAIVADVLDELSADGSLEALGASGRGRLAARVRDDAGALVELFAG